jgi:ankyrin repeat protein
MSCSESEIQDSYDYALRDASENGYLEIAEYLIKNGANIYSLNGVVHIIAQNGHLNIIQYLIENGVNFRYENDLPLRCAAQKEQIHIVKYLIEKGANISLIKNPKIKEELGLPKWNNKPNNMQFRHTNECSISGEILNENVKQLGCSSCKNVFKLEALEHWLNITYRCPYCNSSDEFYLINNKN